MIRYGTTVAIALFFALPVFCSKGVRVTELRVPPEAVLGASIRLVCVYELGDEDLYVVKWYKDDLEFYRYEPKDRNQSVFFPQPGIDIDLLQSGSESVFLRNVIMDSAGIYKCQVSTDAPTYSCVQAVKQMDILTMPLKHPRITGDVDVNDFGANVTLRCTSSKSRPATVLRWFLNGLPASETDITDHGVVLDEKDNLLTSSSSLHFEVNEEHFGFNGTLTVLCKAIFRDQIISTTKRKFTRFDNGFESSCGFNLKHPRLLSFQLVLLFLRLLLVEILCVLRNLRRISKKSSEWLYFIPTIERIE